MSSSWSSKPIAHLVDYLNNEHKEFRTKDLPILSELLVQAEKEMASHGEPIKDMLTYFHDFKTRFLTHMEEEENFLFPKILRTEASANNPELYPEVYKGSVKMYPTTMLHSSDAEFTEMVSTLVTKAQKINSDLPSKVKISNLLIALKDYSDKIHAHAFLEADVLIPRAKKLEDEIKKRL